MKKVALRWMLLLACTCATMRAQSFDLVDGRMPVASLDGKWRFHPGDDMRWADPSFDDSAWPLLRSDADWGQQGYPTLSGLAWYRFAVKAPKGMDKIGLMLPYIFTCYEVYANGRLIGGMGKMPPNTFPYLGGGSYRYFVLPPPENGSSEVKIALRVWHWPGWVKYYGGGPGLGGGGLVGIPDHLKQVAQWGNDEALWTHAASMVLCVVEVLAALGALALFLLRRKDKEYLWFCLMALATAAPNLAQIIEWDSAYVINVEMRDMLLRITAATQNLTTVLLIERLLRPKRTWLFKLALFAIGTALADALVASIFGSPLGVSLDTLVLLLCDVVLFIWMLRVTYLRAKEGSIDARLLLAPLILSIGENLVEGIAWSTFAAGWQHQFNAAIYVTRTPFLVTTTQVVELLFLLGILGVLILRFARTRSEEERYASELNAAQDVQHYLIPTQVPQLPGLQIECAYQPAREVGGDFFQVLPDEGDGSVLIVIGDVAGKGLQAGMLATLIVGAVRMAVKFTSEPRRVMELLNERLQERGLVTCLSIRIEKDGSATAVNAGHLPPYLNGAELEMEGALPLGAIRETTFAEHRFQLKDGDALMLMSDGIAEAQDDHGQLFGFERVGALVKKKESAAAMAEAARAFGQEDDITVLRVMRMAEA